MKQMRLMATFLLAFVAPAAYAGRAGELLVAANGMAFLGTCDAGNVRVTAFRGKSAYVQMDRYELRHRNETLYAVDYDGKPSEFILKSRDGSERALTREKALLGLRAVAPNLYAAILNDVNADQKPPPPTLPTDCRLTDDDKRGNWKKIARTAN